VSESQLRKLIVIGAPLAGHQNVWDRRVAMDVRETSRHICNPLQQIQLILRGEHIGEGRQDRPTPSSRGPDGPLYTLSMLPRRNHSEDNTDRTQHSDDRLECWEGVSKDTTDPMTVCIIPGMDQNHDSIKDVHRTMRATRSNLTVTGKLV
jgi:hypothetical protein